MQIRAPIVLQAVIKSFAEVVLPAVAADNRMAQEQAQLILGLLTLLGQRMPHEFAYDLDELKRLAALGRTLQQLAPDAALTSQVQHGEEVVSRAGASPAELLDAVGALRAVVGEHVSRLENQDSGPGAAARRAVLDCVREQQVRERTWLLMQGWEIDPSSLPTLESLIAVPVTGTRGPP